MALGTDKTNFKIHQFLGLYNRFDNIQINIQEKYLYYRDLKIILEFYKRSYSTYKVLFEYRLALHNHLAHLFFFFFKLHVNYISFLYHSMRLKMQIFLKMGKFDKVYCLGFTLFIIQGLPYLLSRVYPIHYLGFTLSIISSQNKVCDLVFQPIV